MGVFDAAGDTGYFISVPGRGKGDNEGREEVTGEWEYRTFCTYR